MNIFILNDGCVREDALIQNLKIRLEGFFKNKSYNFS